MRKTQKKQAEQLLQTLAQAHDAVGRLINSGQYMQACEILSGCQQGAAGLGNMVEQSEGSDAPVITLLEQYCELVYQIYQSLSEKKAVRGDEICHRLDKLWDSFYHNIMHVIKVRYEILFLPYKASMWDSLESVWMAAQADENCDAYVVPVPYYDKKPDGSFGAYHYEGRDFPTYVPVVDYREYDLAGRQPDAIYIHNPYDNMNYVTSVEPAYYSAELKKQTGCLVYIPYYSTSGGMSEGQAVCPAYENADYIVIQTQKYRKFFDSSLPDEKFLPFGSPKFDRIVRMCAHPPQPSEEWRSRMDGKKVFFYNTSLNGMLGNTEDFLKKMKYVFQCFQGREDACLVWRPHPLMESTFASMRTGSYAGYLELKKYFLEHGTGIYDDTPDIESTIALCDAYIGDSGTSVTSLFAVAGKPLFIMDNGIHTKPEAEDWRGEIVKGFFVEGHNEYMITQGNQLYCADQNHCYRHMCSLSEYSGGDYYSRAIGEGGKIYVCPGNAQDILVIEKGQITRRIQLEKVMEQTGAFLGAWKVGKYLFLIPLKYPAIVRYDTQKDQTAYMSGYQNLFATVVNGQWRYGGNCIWNHSMLLASPVDNRVLILECESGKGRIVTVGDKTTCGCMVLVPEYTTGTAGADQDIWMLPYEGGMIRRWNPATGKVREYTGLPERFICHSQPWGYACMERPFSMAAFSETQVFLSPFWGNMFLCLDKETGEIREWEPPFPVITEKKNGYFNAGMTGYFLYKTNPEGRWPDHFFSVTDARIYDFNLENGEWKECVLEFDQKELEQWEPGFCENSDWLSYSCAENYFNTLDQFIGGSVTGQPFDRERQLRAYRKISGNTDGTCGIHIHRCIVEKVMGGTGL